MRLRARERHRGHGRLALTVTADPECLMEGQEHGLDAAALQAHQDEIARGRRFAFGANWSRFASSVDREAVAEAERSLLDLVPPELLMDGRRLDGLRMLDAGCGSGLFSLAALRLGARVVAFDFDPDSVRTTRRLVDGWTDEAAVQERFTLLHGSVLDEGFLEALGMFDIVYSWGVLHHTGDMWGACNNAAGRVGPEGALVVALYHDTGWTSTAWWYVKRLYVALPTPLQRVLAVLLLLPVELVALVRAVARLGPASYVRRWTAYRSLRGMSRWHDHLDWIGGFPYERASREEVTTFHEERGFRKVRTVPAVAWGNNEFTFVRRSETRAS